MSTFRSSRLARSFARAVIAAAILSAPASRAQTSVAVPPSGAASDSAGSFVVQMGHTAEIHAVEYAPNGRYIASAGKDSTIKLWSPNGALIRSIDTGFWVNDLALTRDSQTIVAGGY